jgi:hypothetical protein
VYRRLGEAKGTRKNRRLYFYGKAHENHQLGTRFFAPQNIISRYDSRVGK